MNNVIIGVDQSYTDTGIALAAESKILTAISLPLSSMANDTSKRTALKDRLYDAMNLCFNKDYEPIVYFEQVRINKGQTTFDYMKRAGAMESVILDLCYYNNVECRSVASNSWKAKILGSRNKVKNSNGIPPEKYMTYQHTHKLGLDKYTLQQCTERTKNYVKRNKQGIKLKFNDNIGDSCCIALYGCLPNKDQCYKVQIEKR